MRSNDSPQEVTAQLDFIVVLIAAAVVSVLLAIGILSSFGASTKAMTNPQHGHGCSSAVQVDPPAGFAPSAIPAYDGSPSVPVNGNAPFFTAADYAGKPFEMYSDLDKLGRCGAAFALVGPETMPTEARDSIGMIRPSGWRIAEYDWIDGRYLYNRCHLIAFSLAGENDNSLNLITGTRSMNVVGMLPYEERVASYIDSTRNHVLYRVTPVFEGDNLVASGVLMEAESVEDGGEGICFCVWCYNVEPGVTIDYATGDNWASSDAGAIGAPSADRGQSAEANRTDADREAPQGAVAVEDGAADEEAVVSGQGFVLNTNTHRFHRPECPSVADMSERNKQPFYGTREEAMQEGYVPCGVCKP